MSHPFVCLLSSVLASPPSVPPTQRTRLHLQPRWDRGPLWPVRRAHSQSLTPMIDVGAGDGSPNMLISFLPSVPPSLTVSVRCRKADVIWWACEDASGLRSTYSLVKKYWRTKHFTFCFSKETKSKQMTNNYIFRLLCMIKRSVYVSAFLCACEWTSVCACVRAGMLGFRSERSLILSPMSPGGVQTLRSPVPIR